MIENIRNRKGARKVEEIPEEVLAPLNTGEIETVNLTEWLGIDHRILIMNVFPQLGIPEEVVSSIEEVLSAQKKPTAMNSTKAVGGMLYDYVQSSSQWDELLSKMTSHVSDTIRCYSAYLISLNANLNILEKLSHSKKLIADSHFGVREVVWMALRPRIEEDLGESIQELSDWAESEDENIRRFTTEATRPRGVWCKHIDLLKEKPEIALPILEKLKSDSSKYVQDSVGNWLNDASKTKPDFVSVLCEAWEKESPTKETARIVKRARRTLNK